MVKIWEAALIRPDLRYFTRIWPSQTVRRQIYVTISVRRRVIESRDDKHPFLHKVFCTLPKFTRQSFRLSNTYRYSPLLLYAFVEMQLPAELKFPLVSLIRREMGSSFWPNEEGLLPLCLGSSVKDILNSLWHGHVGLIRVTRNRICWWYCRTLPAFLIPPTHVCLRYFSALYRIWQSIGLTIHFIQVIEFSEMRKWRCLSTRCSLKFLSRPKSSWFSELDSWRIEEMFYSSLGICWP